MTAQERLESIRPYRGMARLWRDIASQFDAPGLQSFARDFRRRAEREDQKAEEAAVLLASPVLTETERLALSLHYVDNATLAEIGDQINYSRSHTHKIINSALKKLDERSTDET